MNTPRIVGIVLVKNEDLFVERAVRNASGFCDEFLLADHQSGDGTPAILRRLAGELPRASFHALKDPSASHDLLTPYVGTDTWIFGLDGDEIYDPIRLRNLRIRLLAGEFAESWMLLGHALHVTQLETDQATGHMSPPCRSMTKLYNFAAIDSWDGYTPERLHGGRIRFRPLYDESHRRMLLEESTWDDSDFRCLHLCFLPRSSRDRGAGERRNIMELYGPTRLHRAWNLLRRTAGLSPRADWKRSRYQRGPAVTVASGPFFSS